MRDYAGGRDDWIAGGLPVVVEPAAPGDSGDAGLHSHAGPAGSGGTA